MAVVLMEKIAPNSNFFDSLNDEFIKMCTEFYMEVPNVCELHYFLSLNKQQQEDFIIMQVLFANEIIEDIKQEIKNELDRTN